MQVRQMRVMLGKSRPRFEAPIVALSRHTPESLSFRSPASGRHLASCWNKLSRNHARRWFDISNEV